MAILALNSRASLQTLLDSSVLVAPDAAAPAIIYVQTDAEALVISRAAFRHEAGRYGAALLKLGIQPHDLVIIAHTQNLESIYAFWGAMLVGAIPSMFSTLTEKLDPEIYMRDMAELTRLSQTRIVLTTDEFAPELSTHLACPVYGSTALKALVPDDFTWQLPPAPAPESIAFLQHSSGTTGLKKGVALAHDAVLNQLASYSDAIALTEHDVIVSWLPLYHDMGLIAGFLLPLVQGIPLVLMSPFDWAKHPALLLRAIHAYKGTLCWLPNFAYNHCARRIRERDFEGLSLRTMRAFINCSEPVHAESHKLFAERFASLGVTPEMLGVSYAMAENTFAVTQTTPGQVTRQDVVDRHALENERRAVPIALDAPNAVTKVSCGTIITDTQLRVIDQAGNSLPERTVGELAVKSNCMLTEYYRRPDLQPFVEGWYRTGDMGYLADGEAYVIGRSKDLIINAGKNVYPQDVEAIVNTVEGVHPGRAVAFGVYDEREGTELIAVVAEVDTEDEAEQQSIGRAIREAVARASTVSISFVRLVDSKWLIKTSSGKISRGENREKWLREREA